MKESEIRKLVKIVEESAISELEVSRWWRKVRIRKYPSNPGPQAPVASETTRSGKEIILHDHEDVPQGEEFHRIRSPMVGTFYQAPAPDAEPYVKKGDRVVVGQVVCVVEAMKLMNEIESDIKGTVVDILVKDADPVEYGQTLFLVKPD
ncbi:MAG TPA: acetyl-CoA carboxylase biotin carboxyl carrier protein [Candidatus Latescibacteria bacterium]|nr:acetyl-CoA carboxylase biotin carboxyl carrier protein [Candidatus Latescibacterota bacterium]